LLLLQELLLISQKMLLLPELLLISLPLPVQLPLILQKMLLPVPEHLSCRRMSKVRIPCSVQEQGR